MRNAGLDEVQAGIKTARRNINNLRHVNYTTLTAKAKMVIELGFEVETAVCEVEEGGLSER